MKGWVNTTPALWRLKLFSVCMSLEHANIAKNRYTRAGFASTERQIAFVSTQFLLSCFLTFDHNEWDLAGHSLPFWHWSDISFKSYCLMNKTRTHIRQNGVPCLTQLVINQSTFQITFLTDTVFDVPEHCFCQNNHDFLFLSCVWGTMPVWLIAQFFFEHFWTECLKSVKWPSFSQKQ